MKFHKSHNIHACMHQWQQWHRITHMRYSVHHCYDMMKAHKLVSK